MTAIHAPEAPCGLLVAEPLTVVALCEASLVFVCFNPYNDVTEGDKGEDSL